MKSVSIICCISFLYLLSSGTLIKTLLIISECFDLEIIKIGFCISRTVIMSCSSTALTDVLIVALFFFGGGEGGRGGGQGGG